MLVIDYNHPEAVLRAFMIAMNQWESEAWQQMRATRDTSEPASYQADVLAQMRQIFVVYCTPKARPYGRQGSFSSPPEYDVNQETIRDVQHPKPRRCLITTEHPFWGRRRYVLLKQGGRWLIDSKQAGTGEKGWRPSIL